MKLDQTVEPIVGPARCGLDVPNDARVELCGACGDEFFVLRALNLKRVRKVIRRRGLTPKLLCLPCARPWIQEIAMEGGVISSPNERIADSAEGLVEATRHETAASN